MALQTKELLDLQALDTEIGKLQTERAALDRGDRVERALAVRRAKLEAAERRLKGLEIEQRNSEMELKTLEEKKQQTSRRLYDGKTTAPRELQALEMEVGMLERQRQRLDEQILKRIDEMEQAKQSQATARGAVDEAEKALKIMKRRFDKEAGRIDAELGKFQPQRDKIAATVAPDTLRRYDDLRRRNHNVGAARVQNGACGGCRMKVSTVLQRRLATLDQYVYCESCSRFLFAPEEEAAK